MTVPALVPLSSVESLTKTRRVRFAMHASQRFHLDRPPAGARPRERLVRGA
jgi:hypothetical protein